MPAAASARSRSLPAGPTKGCPARSSSLPGCSPTISTSARAVPSPKTVCVPRFQSSHALQPAAAARSFGSVGRSGTSGAAVLAAVRMAASGSAWLHLPGLDRQPGVAPPRNDDPSRRVVRATEAALHVRDVGVAGLRQKRARALRADPALAPDEELRRPRDVALDGRDEIRVRLRLARRRIEEDHGNVERPGGMPGLELRLGTDVEV